MRDVLRDAILTYNPECCIWVTDGGTENKNAEVTSMLRRYNKKIKHAVAMSDILQSNSMIERVFYTLKYTQRLRGIEIRSIEDAVEFMDWFVDDYNSRPHSVHGLFGPNEMYDGINTFDYSGVLKKGMAKRKIVNAQCSCTKCICGVSDSK